MGHLQVSHDTARATLLSVAVSIHATLESMRVTPPPRAETRECESRTWNHNTQNHNKQSTLYLTKVLLHGFLQKF